MAEKNLIALLEDSGLYLSTAESLTGGLLGSALTANEGASKVYLGGVIAYQNAVKQELVGVSSQLIQQQGAVDAEVAAQLAIGVRERFAKVNQLPSEAVIGISTTGVAGPGSAEGKAAGTVFIGLSGLGADVVYAHEFSGDRSQIREQTVAAALRALREQLQLSSGL